MKWWAALGVLALMLWAYTPVWSAGWVYEDRTDQALNTHRPLTAWTWRVLTTPRSAHVASVILALVVAGLLGCLVWRLGGSLFAAGSASAIWLLHPLMAETIAYASSRAELLAAIGILIACLAATITPWWRVPALVGIAIGSLMALTSKESGVVVALLVPLVIVFLAPRRLSSYVPAAIAFYLLAAGISYLGGLRAVANYGSTQSANALAITWIDWAGLQATAVGHWLVSAVTLTGLTPDVDVDVVPLAGRWVNGALLLALGASAIVLWRSAPRAAFGLTWCLLAIAPRFLVQQPQGTISAHQFTVPFLGLVLAGAGALASKENHSWAS